MRSGVISWFLRTQMSEVGAESKGSWCPDLHVLALNLTFLQIYNRMIEKCLQFEVGDIIVGYLEKAVPMLSKNDCTIAIAKDVWVNVLGNNIFFSILKNFSFWCPVLSDYYSFWCLINSDDYDYYYYCRKY